MGRVRAFVDRPMVGQGGQAAPLSAEAVVGVGRIRPVGAEVKLAADVRNPWKKCAASNGGWKFEPARRLQLRQRPASRDAQRLVDDLARAHVEAPVLGAEPAGER